jgi:aerobic-type carbon monoxide dehydrogenase small subunit (CoxS/CutS family)
VRQERLVRHRRFDTGRCRPAAANDMEEGMVDELKIRVNERPSSVAASPDTPLLYVLTNELNLHGPRFGCGLAQCGSCSVLVDGVETRSCVTPVGAVEGKSVTTLEGLPAFYARQRGLAETPALHPLQRALIDEQAPQCGYCYNGMIIKGSELLARVAQPSDAEIRQHMNGHLCRCGSYPRVMNAIRLASRMMTEERR